MEGKSREAPATRTTTTAPALAVKDLRLVRGGKQILSIDELTIDRGEVLAVVGPNGAGKTSLLQTLAMLQPPSSGSITLGGELVNKRNLPAFRRRTASVFQEALLLDMTVERNIAIGLRIRGVAAREAKSRARIWLERFGISHLAARSARHLSGGEAQRASLARAFALEPEILFLDEPFAALDYPTHKSLLSDMGRLLAQMSLTTLFVTHDYTEIPYLASRAAVLFDGSIIKSGPIRDVFGDELLDRKLRAPWEVEETGQGNPVSSTGLE